MDITSALKIARKYIKDNPDGFPCSENEIDAILVQDPQSKGGASRIQIYDTKTFMTILTIDGRTGKVI